MARIQTSFLILFLCLCAAGSVHAEEDLNALIEEAQQYPRGSQRYLESVRFGTRGVIMVEFAMSPSDPKWMYMASADGFVFTSNDGGKSWTEGRLIVRRPPFFGSLRPSPAHKGAPFSAQSTLSAFQKQGMLKNSMSDRFAFSDGSTNVSFLDLDPGGPAFWALPNPGIVRAGDRSIRDGFGGGGDEGDASRYGVGLFTGAPRLGALLKKRGMRPAGMNLQLLLSLRGMEPTWINMLAVNPMHPERALAATSMGVFSTNDGGYSWGNIFPGRNLFERDCRAIYYHPTDPNQVFLGTRQGLLRSIDGGLKFERVRGTQLSSALVYWVEFYQGNPDIIYAGTNIGAFRSDDGGLNWRWIFFETLPQQNRVYSITLDPRNPDRATISTADGLFKTANGGRIWERSGAFMFTSIGVYRIVSDPLDGNHLTCITWRHVWETHDWGDTWKAVYISDSEWSPRSLRYDDRDPNLLWLMTSHEFLKLSDQAPEPIADADVGRLRAYLETEPPLTQLMDETFRHQGVHRGELGKKRERARLRGLVPTFNAFAGVFSVDDIATLNPVYLAGLPQGETEVLNVDYDITMPYFGAILNWNLEQFVFHVEEPPYGRYFTQANSAYLMLRYEVQRLYEERRRLLILIFTRPPTDARENIIRWLRLEELTAHLDALSGGTYQQILTSIEDGTFEKELGQ